MFYCGNKSSACQIVLWRVNTQNVIKWKMHNNAKFNPPNSCHSHDQFSCKSAVAQTYKINQMTFFYWFSENKMQFYLTMKCLNTHLKIIYALNMKIFATKQHLQEGVWMEEFDVFVCLWRNLSHKRHFNGTSISINLLINGMQLFTSLTQRWLAKVFSYLLFLTAKPLTNYTFNLIS